jgi:hypothetical protein
MVRCLLCHRNSIISRPMSEEMKTVQEIDRTISLQFDILVHQCQNHGCYKNWYQCDLTCGKAGHFDGYWKMIRHAKQCHLSDTFSVLKTVSMGTELIAHNVEPLDSFEFFGDDDEFETSLDLNPEGVDDSNIGTHFVVVPSMIVQDIPRFEGQTSCNTRCFQSISLNEFLNNCKTIGYYKAVSRLVTRAAYQTPTPPVEHISGPMLMIFLTIARLVLLTPDSVHRPLSYILSFFTNTCRYFMGRCYPSLPLPVTLSDFQSMILNATNTNSIRSILPIPCIIYNKKTEHTILSPTEVVPMIMFMPPNIKSNSGVCPRYRSTIKSESFYERRNRIPRQYLDIDNTVPSVMVYDAMV